MRSSVLCAVCVLVFSICPIVMAQTEGLAGRQVQGVRAVIEAKDVVASKIEFRDDHSRPAENVMMNERGMIVATVTNKSAIQLTGVRIRIEVDQTVVRRDDLTIGPGASQELTWAYAFTSAGNHIITLLVDPDNQIDETAENNNRAEKVIIVTAPLYDVRATSLTCTAGGRQVTSVPQGTIVEFTGIATNAGNVPVTRAAIKLLVDGSMIREATESIEPGRTASLARQHTFNGPGRHTVIFIVDADNTYQETDENNNRIEKSIEVVAPPPAQSTQPAATGGSSSQSSGGGGGGTGLGRLRR